MSTIVKVLAGVVGAGTLGGAGIGAYYAFSSDSNTISKQLLAEGFTLAKSNEEWVALKAKYQSANKDTFSGVEKTNIDLKSKCETLLNEKPNESNYKLARKWCVKEQNIKEILEKGGYKILDSVEENTGDDTSWQQKVDLLKPNLKRFKAVETTIKQKEAKLGDNVKELKKACKNLTVDTILTTVDAFGENFDLAKEWCSIKKTN